MSAECLQQTPTWITWEICCEKMSNSWMSAECLQQTPTWITWEICCEKISNSWMSAANTYLDHLEICCEKMSNSWMSAECLQQTPTWITWEICCEKISNSWMSAANTYLDHLGNLLWEDVKQLNVCSKLLPGSLGKFAVRRCQTAECLQESLCLLHSVQTLLTCNQRGARFKCIYKSIYVEQHYMNLQSKRCMNQLYL